ncbi:MAG: lipopolysaccharide heptosyltransferase II [bacterium]
MPVSLESVISKASDAAPRLLVVSPTWLGDCVMAMPALNALRKQLPRARITLLAKPSVAPVWSLFPGIEGVIPLKKGLMGMLDTISKVKAGQFDFAFILPNSFRSAWIPWLAGIPGRRGVPGQNRCWMLTESVHLSSSARAGHQSLEMAEILHLPVDRLEAPPFLFVPRADRERASRLLPVDRPCVAFFPGASYGPAKRWPAERFASLGTRLVAEQGCSILVLGGKADKPVCDEVAGRIGGGAINLAGETDLIELAGLLGPCRAVVANDSGGMHLAAGLGVALVGIFGLTDPVKTAPVGACSRVLCAEGVVRSRDIARDSLEARNAMESIAVETVYQTVLASLKA